MNRILSLFDYTGSWPGIFADRGYDVWCWDLQHGNDIFTFDSCETTLDIIDFCNGILAAIPCTDFSGAGAQYWPAKDADGRTQMSMALVNRTLALVDLFWPTDPDYDGSFFWTIENPVGRIHKLFPQLGSGWYFHPWEYAGHLNLSDSDHNELDRIRRKDAVGVTMDEAMFVLQCNAYTKKTGLWGSFNRDLQKSPIEPVRCCKQGSPLMMLGGKSMKTKNIRSATPQGFAKAFFEANDGWRPDDWFEGFYGITQN